MFLNANQQDNSLMKIANLGELPRSIKLDMTTAVSESLWLGTWHAFFTDV